ncbi:hypothetical protein [Nostoc sp. PCC 7107]|uniref:hypothetical protein n=1 Tax=Nostoc sp. PCC 7107 TaxID=317936 RepID=UPI00029EF801|nr:hypothetical protein [Nostoc sp. PCC 7107]AFY45888.1 hypothetical protein Nos7107_5405 [Nostoc sp. PCC 7107]
MSNDDLSYQVAKINQLELNLRSKTKNQGFGEGCKGRCIQNPYTLKPLHPFSTDKLYATLSFKN